MKWALSELNKFKNDQLRFTETIDLEESLKQREPQILAVEPIRVDGFIQVDTGRYLAHFTMDTVLTLPSSRSLTPVKYPLTLTIDEDYMTESTYAGLADISEDEKSLIMVLEKDLIDLTEAVEDFILLNLPLQILTEEEMTTTDLPKGEFWNVISEEDLKAKKHLDELESEDKIDPRLAKLSELLLNDDNE